MEPLLAVACALAAVALVAADVRALRGDPRAARIAVPLGAVLVLALGVAERWPPTAWPLVVVVLVGPPVLAYRVATPAAWNVVLVYALAGSVAGYGLLDELLARADGGQAADRAVAAAALGGAVGAVAYAWLYVEGLVRR
jgi:hypothetical protein